MLSKLNKQIIPFFSVIVPVYNKGPHVKRSISSILDQSFDNFELLIINDASTDSSLSQISKFKDKRIRLFNRKTPGQGGYAARNLGIKNSIGEWVAFLDADDEWYSNHLKELYYLITSNNDIQIVSTCWKIVTEKNEHINSYCKLRGEVKYKTITFSEYLVSNLKRCSPFCTNVISIKKNVLIKIGGFPEDKFEIVGERGGDTDTWLRAISYSKISAWSSKITAIYYRNSFNMVTKSIPSTGLYEKNTIKKLLCYEQDPKNKKLLKKYSNYKLLNGSVNAIISGFKIQKGHLLELYFFALSPKQISILFLILILPEKLFLIIFKIYTKFKNNFLRKRFKSKTFDNLK